MGEEINTTDYFANKAKKVLENKIGNIRTVEDWSNKINYSRSYFCTLVKEHFGEPPSQILYKTRYKAICDIITEKPDSKSFAIALEAGLCDEQALYIFLSTHFDTNFTELREDILNKQTDMRQKEQI